MSENNRMLAADTLEGIEMLRNMLEETVELVATTSIHEALEILKGDIDLVLCGAHFDDSQMLGLLRRARIDIETRDKPILCYRNLGSELPNTTLRRLRFMCTALGAVGFVDLYLLKQQLGTAQAEMQFKRTVFQYLKPGNQ
ncbi:hypothetical protein [Nitrosovibrio sp. Nv6]|uniref:hypothetical protein n=1 Tax=Nitrosovibrio sp. Nv6 TaxID=1855340 RepID=UPI00115FDCAA|nr:hypothetical protein [Nitrosovibrio sp. Nv6]